MNEAIPATAGRGECGNEPVLGVRHTIQNVRDDNNFDEVALQIYHKQVILYKSTNFIWNL
ncbi:MAG: hypothetical protein RI575_07670 [Balneolaceae bacterium]|nr:hypothetical protein [Balneolaceae bacterium]MDR9408610.1 hypothetical protein [Balneolaceae bacterium]